MKKLVMIIILLIPIFLSAQNGRDGKSKWNKEQFDKERARIEQLEKIKLIEILNTDEATVMKFFARRNEYFNKDKNFREEMKNMTEKFESSMKSGKKFSNKYYQYTIDKVFSMDREKVKRRENFYRSLDDILTKEQIAKLVIFAKRFNEEMMNEVMKGGK
jgi:hypothetical protein